MGLQLTSNSTARMSSVASIDWGNVTGKPVNLNAEQIIALTAPYTLTSTTASQKLFNASTAGALTVAASATYTFECFYSLSSMSASSGNGKFDLLGAGTATLTSAAFDVIGQDAATPGTAGTVSGNFTATSITSGDAVTAATNTAAYFRVRGIFRVNGGGTLIPSVALTTAAVAVVGTNSYFRALQIGSDTVTTVGAWT